MKIDPKSATQAAKSVQSEIPMAWQTDPLAVLVLGKWGSPTLGNRKDHVATEQEARQVLGAHHGHRSVEVRAQEGASGRPAGERFEYAGRNFAAAVELANRQAKASPLNPGSPCSQAHAVLQAPDGSFFVTKLVSNDSSGSGGRTPVTLEAAVPGQSFEAVGAARSVDGLVAIVGQSIYYDLRHAASTGKKTMCVFMHRGG